MIENINIKITFKSNKCEVCNEEFYTTDKDEPTTTCSKICNDIKDKRDRRDIAIDKINDLN